MPLILEVLAYLLRDKIAQQPASNQAGIDRDREYLARVEDAIARPVSPAEEAQRVLLRRFGV